MILDIVCCILSGKFHNVSANEIQLACVYLSYLRAENAAIMNNISKCQIYIQAIWNSQFPKQEGNSF